MISPRFESAGRAIDTRANPRPRTATPVGTSFDSHQMYARMPRISSLSYGNGLPFIDRSKQSLTRSCNALTCPLRLRYSGNTPQSPTHGEAYALRPASRWQLEQLRPFPTYGFA